MCRDVGRQSLADTTHQHGVVLKDLGQEENPEVPAQDEDGRDVNGVVVKDRGE